MNGPFSCTMHFSIPDTQEITSAGISYTAYNLHVNGVFHCTVRYRQLFSLFERIKKDFASISIGLPRFPPKKLLPLSSCQLEERRLSLEKYIQAVGQDATLSHSELFHEFLLTAQQATSGVATENTTVDVFLTNGLRVTLETKTNARTDYTLWAVCDKISLPRELAIYFCLYLEKREDDGDFILQRRLQDFESPHISLAALTTPHRIVLRKSYWDSNLDLTVMNNKVGLNLLYLQTVNEVEKGWVLCSQDNLQTLATYQSQGAKRQYMDLARGLKFYGYLQFKPCTCDYPYAWSKVMVGAGNRELNLRVRLTDDDDIRQGCFKVTRIRCWRITTLHGDGNGTPPSLELSFEYLMAKNKLQWITIVSEQAVLMSMCLQSMVEELMDDTRARSSRSNDTSSSSEATPSTSKRELPGESPGSSGRSYGSNSTNSVTNGNSSVTNGHSESSVKRSSSKHCVSYNTAKAMVQNECFDNDGIGDDDL